MTNDRPDGRTPRPVASFSDHVRQHNVETLMQRTATPDRRDGLDTQWAETVDRLRAFIAARVEDREIAAEITQDVIVRSIASGALERVDDPVAWLYRSARNAVIDHYRTRHHHDPLDEPDRWPDPDTADDVPNDATRELSRCLQPLLDHLAPDAREALERVDTACSRWYSVGELLRRW